MALNWVMLPDTATSPSKSDFIPLPSERPLFKSSIRTSLSLTSPKSTYPAHSPNLTITSSDGTLYLTTQRVIYLPRSNATIVSNVASFKSFSSPLLNLHDTHMVMPWFGPNAWTALVQPVPGGNLPSSTAGLELKLTFKEGGAPEFQGKFEAIKERLQQVVDVARQANSSSNQGSLDMSGVHLDQLPSYQDSGHDQSISETTTSSRAIDNHDHDQDHEQDASAVPPTNATAEQVRAMAAAAATQRDQETIRRQSREDEVRQETPSDAPPGYEEAQQQSVQAEFEWRTEAAGR